ncbi:MAG: hypothetical protein QOJ70_2989 [Acidobacteriota bacterium]|jgi:hypothetical protein|nr:hypothetical protein [Acidobacteriota bacterium]MDT7809176.1 hypothetical protein [Acidobacteriota bacterium]
MNRRHYLLTVALSLFAGLAGHALYGALLTPQPVLARALAEPRDSQWEYCAVVKSQIPGSVRLIYWIAYFKGEGVKIEPIEAGLSGNSFGKAVAKLGEDGWEMVGEGPLDVRPDPRPGPSVAAPDAVFFKRRKD